jgi:hypothetical protein
MCTGTPSDNLSTLFESRRAFALVYLESSQLHDFDLQHNYTYTAICETFIKTLLTIFGPNPFVKLLIPSSFPILIKPLMAFGYRYLWVGVLAPSAHIRTNTTFDTTVSLVHQLRSGEKYLSRVPQQPSEPSCYASACNCRAGRKFLPCPLLHLSCENVI